MKAPGTFIEFAKNFIDEINAFHSRGALNPNYNTLNLSGLHFYDSIVVAEKNEIASVPFKLRIGKPTIVDFPNAL